MTAVRVSLSGADASPDGVAVVDVGAGEGQATIDGRPGEAALRRLDAIHARLRLEDPASVADWDILLLPPGQPSDRGSGAVRREVVVGGWRFELDVELEARAALRSRATRGRERAGRSGPLDVRAMIPGRVVSIEVAVGDPVTLGQRVMVIEAMKMQNELRAPRDGTVARIAAVVGQTIEAGDLLVVVESRQDGPV